MNDGVEDPDDDEDGSYPSEADLKTISAWQPPYGPLMAFVRERWAYAHSGHWEEEPHAVDGVTSRETYRYEIATAGWSGNESLIEALEKNYMFWLCCWVQSRRGGHFIFEIGRHFQ